MSYKTLREKKKTKKKTTKKTNKLLRLRLAILNMQILNTQLQKHQGEVMYALAFQIVLVKNGCL